MSLQKFHRGNSVHIAAKLDRWMSHFRSDADVVIIGSYCDQYHRHGRPQIKLPSGPYSINDMTVPFIQPENCCEPNGHSYTVLFDPGGTCSWYDERQLTLIDEGGEHLIDAIHERDKQREAQQTDLNWIVQNWATIRKNPSGFTANYLMQRCGISSPWGSQGEGMAWYANWRQTFALIDPILSGGSIMAIDEFFNYARTVLRPIDVRIGG